MVVQDFTQLQRVFQWWKVLSWQRIRLIRAGKGALARLAAATRRRRRAAGTVAHHGTWQKRRVLRRMEELIGACAGHYIQDHRGTSSNHIERAGLTVLLLLSGCWCSACQVLGPAVLEGR